MGQALGENLLAYEPGCSGEDDFHDAGACSVVCGVDSLVGDGWIGLDIYFRGWLMMNTLVALSYCLSYIIRHLALERVRI